MNAAAAAAFNPAAAAVASLSAAGSFQSAQSAGQHGNHGQYGGHEHHSTAAASNFNSPQGKHAAAQPVFSEFTTPTL